MAVLAVSLSRISPTMMTSGSIRTKERSAEAKVSPIPGFTCICSTPSMRTSTGSSTVKMLRVGSLSS